jgi:hypothetical protein
MALSLEGSVNISGSMTATTILVSSPGGGGMLSSSQQIQNYNLFAVTSSANTFYGNQSVISGNLGVGTTTPLVASGYSTISVNNVTNGGIIDLQQNGTSVARFGNNGTSVAFLETRTATPITISTNDTQRVRITSDGQTQISGSLRILTPNRSFFITTNAYSISDGTLSSGFGMDGDGLYLGNAASSTGWTISNPQVTIRSTGKVGMGASTNPTYILEASTAAGSERIRVGTLQNNDNTATFEAITSAGISSATSGWIRALNGGGLAVGTSTYTKAGGDSGNFANLSAESATTAITVNGGDVQLNGSLFNTSDVISIPNSATTIFTSTGYGGVWFVSYVVSGNPSQVGYAIVGNAFGSTLTVLASAAGSQTALSVSGLNLQLSQSAGGSINTRVNVIKLNTTFA